MKDALLAILGIAGGVSMALVLAGIVSLVSDVIWPWLEGKFQK